MIIQRIWPLSNNHLANDHPEDPASCKWSSRGSSFLQIIIRPLVNDHLEDPASCKWSSGGSGLSQMIIWRIQSLSNDHPEDPASCKWSSGGSGLLQMIIQRIWPLAHDHLEGLASYKWSSVTPVVDSFIYLYLCPYHISYMICDDTSCWYVMYDYISSYS